jgi:glycine/D-amino acid oxidase-like deaminating enzyme
MMGCCTLIVFLKLLVCLDSQRGFHNREEVFEDLGEVVSDRTVQRWLKRAMENAVSIQQAIGAAARDRREPRPGEDLFEGGLSPPDDFYARPWANPLAAESLWRAIAMLLVASRELGVNASLLLAEARRRCQRTEKPFPI